MNLKHVPIANIDQRRWLGVSWTMCHGQYGMKGCRPSHGGKTESMGIWIIMISLWYHRDITMNHHDIIMISLWIIVNHYESLYINPYESLLMIIPQYRYFNFWPRLLRCLTPTTPSLELCWSSPLMRIPNGSAETLLPPKKQWSTVRTWSTYLYTLGHFWCKCSVNIHEATGMCSIPTSRRRPWRGINTTLNRTVNTKLDPRGNCGQVHLALACNYHVGNTL